MKIVIVGPGFPLRGGIADFNEALCSTLNLQNHDCEIVSFTLQYPSFLFPGKTQIATGNSPDNCKITEIINSLNPISWGKAAKYIIAQQPDMVVFRFWIPFIGKCLGSIAKRVRKKGIHTIAITDNVIPHEKRFGDKALTNYFLKQIDAFIVMSKSVESDIKSFNINKPIVYVPHPVYDIFGVSVSTEEAREKLQLEKSGNYVLFFGLIRKYKGLDLLLDAMADSRLKELNVKLIVAGEFYGNEEQYRNQISNLNLSPRVIIVNHFIDSLQVKYYFCAANIVAQTYNNATQSGITQIAYHFNKPMLVTNVGGLAEIVPHNVVGYVCKKDPYEIAKSLVNYFTENREAEFSTNVAKEKLHFSWDNFSRELFALCKKIPHVKI